MNFRHLTTKNSTFAFLCAILVSISSSAMAANAPYGSGSISLSGFTLIINGTSLDDRATVTEISGDRIKVILNGKSYKYPSAGITEVQFIGQAGDDDFVNRTPLLAMAFGGDGDDMLKSTDGQAMFYGGLGDDSLLGSPNDDFLCGGSDDDVIFGFHGDDQISGDAGTGDGSGGGGGGGDIDARIVGAGAFARGKFVQIGVNEQGTFGRPYGSVPAGYVDVLSDGRSRNGLFGFIADTGKDGYAGGGYAGDFFTPGTPEEGFGVEIDGANFNNNTDGNLQEISGMLVSASTGDSADINWLGAVSGLDVARRISVYEQGLFIRIEVTLTNRSGSSLADVYYLNNVDPDNNQTVNGSFSTFNTIVSQGDSAADNLSLVTAQQTAFGPGMSGGTEATGSALSLVSFDPRARVSYGGFSNRNASAVYNATGGFEGAVGATRSSDIGISLAFNVGTMASGQSTKLVYYYSLDPTGVDISGITEIENACADGGLTGDDIVYGGHGNDFIDTDSGEDIIYGGNDDDVIDSGRDDDRVYGQSGNDDIVTGPGNDRAYGGSDDDTIIVNAGNDRAYGDSGSDFLGGGNGNDFLHGGSGNDTVAGHAGNDDLLGGGGDDNLYGGPGVDDLNGGAGTDREIQ